MNSIFPEKLSEMNRKRIRDEIAAIRLEEEADHGRQKWLDKNLANLGDWMVAKGNKLRKRGVSMPKGSIDLLQDSAR